LPSNISTVEQIYRNNVLFPRLRLTASSGAPLPFDVYYKARKIVNLPHIEGYGLTVASPSSPFNPPSYIHKPGFIGLVLVDNDAIGGGKNDEEMPIGNLSRFS
jgi:acyl-coenzyme A synthetase/AMP-(fatty) acid ligase